MRLAAIYNFFNGEEHLIASLRSIRAQTDFICLVAQRLSNTGLPLSAEAEHVLDKAKEEGLVDEILWYTPEQSLTARQNELAKRKLGLRCARQSKSSHFFTIDADEFYRDRELAFAKEFILANNVNSTSVSSFFHVKSPKYRFRDTTNVAFITKLGYLTQLGDRDYPTEQVDSTRKVRQFFRRHHHFTHTRVAMYHMNFVRRDFQSKFKNTSTTNREYLNDVRSKIDEYHGEPMFVFPQKGTFEMTPAVNEFNTYDPE